MNDYQILETEVLKLKEDRGLVNAKLNSLKSSTDTNISELKALNDAKAIRISEL